MIGVVCLVLAGCATPEQRCINEATRDLRTVNELIAETEANLSRGYAIVTETDISPRLTFCTGYRDNVGISFCSGNQLIQRDRPVAIDREAEERKLVDLRGRRAALEVTARRAVAACRA